MKKFFAIMMIAFTMMVGFSSCDKKTDNVNFGVDYTLTVAGDGDGQVEVTFPQGRLGMNGDADVDFCLSNDTVSMDTLMMVSKANILSEGDSVKVDAMRKVNDYLASQFNATAASGTYDLSVRGYARERVTGLCFEIDRHFTNRDSVNLTVGDEFMYIK